MNGMALFDGVLVFLCVLLLVLVHAQEKFIESQQNLIQAYQDVLGEPVLGEPVLGEPVALRHSFDGYGWMYTDNGSGSNWKDRSYPDKEFVYVLR